MLILHRLSVYSVLVLLGIAYTNSHADDCSEGYEETIVYRVVSPGRSNHGMLWCCDYVRGGERRGDALKSCERFYDSCEQIPFDDVSPEEWTKYFKEAQTYLAIGQSSVKAYEQKIEAQDRQPVEVPDPDAIMKRGYGQDKAPPKKACIKQGSRIGDHVFLGKSDRGVIFKYCDVKLKKVVIMSLTFAMYYKNYLPQQITRKEGAADQVRKAIKACEPSYCTINKRTYPSHKACWAACASGLICFAGGCCTLPP